MCAWERSGAYNRVGGSDAWIIMRTGGAGSVLTTLLVVMLTATSCSSPSDGKGVRDAERPSARAARKGPPGLGGPLVGARWKVEWLVVGGRQTTAPPYAAAAWMDFGYDNTVTGSDGCIPFKRTAEAMPGT